MFSVIIPVYNHNKYLREAVASALASDLVKEVLLCDDGSKDGSAELCHQLATDFPNRVRDCSEKPSVNRGAHNRLNQLCLEAKQPWIRVLNSDDYFLPGSFETLRLLAFTNCATCISGSMLICNEYSSIIGTKKGIFDPEYPLPQMPVAKPLLKNDEVRNLLLSQNFIATTSNMAFTRELYVRIGGFADFRYSHDLDFALRATILGNVIHTSSFLVTYRIHGSNTISEVSPHMDGEITRLYGKFLNDFPEVEKNPDAHHFLDNNLHIRPFPPSPEENISCNSTRRYPDNILIPELPNYTFPNIFLALGCINYDFIIISNGLSEPPLLESSGLHASLIAVGPACNLAEENNIHHQNLRGRIIRCPNKEIDTNSLLTIPMMLANLQSRAEGSDVFIGQPSAINFTQCDYFLELLRNKLCPDDTDQRPVVFVMPIFLAVGGVERNTIEVIRLLRNCYRFVVITTEWLAAKQGSLHWQLYEMDIPVLDLAEITIQENHLNLLTILARIFPPQLVWICNGSPWLVENAVQLRRIFANVPIIDQEVYDTKEGWIGHYHKKGIQSFDRFIAINSHIEKAFLKSFLIPPHRVTLIHPMLAEDPVLKARERTVDRLRLLEELGVSVRYNKVFVFVGRLSEQKRPFAFLELVRKAKEMNKNCFFLMVGDGELSAECDAVIEKNALTNLKRIHYHPCPPDLMALADGMIITSIYEGLPIAMLEALGVGIPVLATDVGDIRIVLERFGSGQIFDHIELASDPKSAYLNFSNFLDSLHHFSKSSLATRDEICSVFGKKNISNAYNILFQSSLHDYSIA